MVISFTHLCRPSLEKHPIRFTLLIHRLRRVLALPALGTVIRSLPFTEWQGNSCARPSGAVFMCTAPFALYNQPVAQVACVTKIGGAPCMLFLKKESHLFKVTQLFPGKIEPNPGILTVLNGPGILILWTFRMSEFRIWLFYKLVH